MINGQVQSPSPLLALHNCWARCSAPAAKQNHRRQSNIPFARCPLLRPKQTFVRATVMSALCQTQTFCTAIRNVVFDHLVSEEQLSVGSMLPGYRYLSCEAHGHFRNGARMITLGEYSIS